MHHRIYTIDYLGQVNCYLKFIIRNILISCKSSKLIISTRSSEHIHYFTPTNCVASNAPPKSRVLLFKAINRIAIHAPPELYVLVFKPSKFVMSSALSQLRLLFVHQIN